MCKRDTDEAVWLGLSRSANNESFKWSDGSEVAFVNWDDDEPGTGTVINTGFPLVREKVREF